MAFRHRYLIAAATAAAAATAVAAELSGQVVALDSIELRFP